MRFACVILPMLLAACVPDLGSSPVDTAAWTAPDNAWPSATPPADLSGQGFYVGQVAPDFRLLDQNGDDVSLWQFYGRPVVLDISTMWCRPCQQLATGAADTAQAYAADGLVYLTVLPENVQGDPPTTDDLDAWVQAFGLDSPVVADPGRVWSAPAVPHGQYPFVAVLDAGMQVGARVDPPTDDNLRAAIDGVLAGASSSSRSGP